jgi:hypothetical protein
MALFCIAITGSAESQTHCGTERWSIKTGTDAGSSGIDIANPTPATIASLVGLNAPSLIPPGSRVGPAETTAWVVNGNLIAFKIEDGKSGDSDYHLVIADENGATMIVEIPHPSCVKGASPFLQGIAKARQEFDARFSPSSAFQNVAVPVQVVGIGMFDFAHGQRGYAANGIELHPVLDISFRDESVTPNFITATAPPPPGPAPAVATSQILKDPSFEAGHQKPSAWNASTGVINSSASEPAHSGKWKAWLGGTGAAHTDKLSQTVTIPASVKSAILSFWLRIATDEVTTTRDLDTLTISVKDEQGNQVPIDDEEGTHTQTSMRCRIASERSI